MHTGNDEGFEVREVFFEDEGGAGECPFVFLAYRASHARAENDGDSLHDARPSQLAAG